MDIPLGVLPWILLDLVEHFEQPMKMRENNLVSDSGLWLEIHEFSWRNYKYTPFLSPSFSFQSQLDQCLTSIYIGNLWTDNSDVIWPSFWQDQFAFWCLFDSFYRFSLFSDQNRNQFTWYRMNIKIFSIILFFKTVSNIFFLFLIPINHKF